MIKALVFDMDGLLLDSERIVKRSWNDAGDEVGVPNVGEQIYHTLGMNRRARNEYFKKVFGEDFPLEEFNERTSVCFYRIVEKEGLPVKAGAKELLKYAKEHGYKIAVATSSSRQYARKVLTDAGIYSYFDGGVFGDMVEHAKPDPEIYEKACESIRVRPEDAIALEDAPAGVRSAYAAGLKVIVIPDLVQPSKEILELTYQKFDTLNDVISLLEAERQRKEE